MLRRIFLTAAVAVSLLGASAAAQVHHRPGPAAHLPGVRVVNLHRAYEARLGHTKPGRISGITYARGKAPRARPQRQATCTEPACPVLYNNGPVQVTPHIYLLLWGPNWSTDPSQEATAQYLENFYAGLGARQPGQAKDNWSTIISQYGDSSGAPIFSQSVFVKAFNDTTTPPTGATQAQIAAEADAFATSQGVTDLTDAQIVVATQHGACPAGFFAPSVCGGTGTYCAWHSSSNEPYINLPYLLDAGTSCGENFVNSGPAGLDDGFSLIGGAEYADTITNPEPNGIAPGTSPDPAWVDTGDNVSGGEIAQKCAFDQPWGANTPHGDVTLSTGSFAMQSLWSNDANGCVLSDTVTITSPGGQSSVAGSSVSLQMGGKSSAGYPLIWSSTTLPPHLTLGSSTGLITGIPTTLGTYGVTVTAADAAGTSRAVSFIWTITAAGKPITGPNSKCLDDSGAGTANRTKVDIWTCNNTAAQDWTFSGGELGVLGKCLDDVTGGGSGSLLVIFTCNGHKTQTWSHKSDGEYVLKLNNECLTDPSKSSVNGTQVQIRDCKNSSDQHWSLP